MTLHLYVLEHEPETGLDAFAAYLEAAAVGDRFDGAVALGGSLDAYEPWLLETRRWIRNAVGGGLPFLGVCLGGQLLASALGGVVTRGRPELGLHVAALSPTLEAAV